MNQEQPFKIIWNIIKSFFTEKPGIIILSAIILLMLWGYHGNLDLLRFIIKDWSAPGINTGTRTPILTWVPWDRELISFWGGALLVVFIPILIILFKFKHSLINYGLDLPAADKRKPALILFIVLILISIVPFYFAAKDSEMQCVYPFYKTFTGKTQFFIYELSYFPFFLAIEFIFRGYLLFGLANNGLTSATLDPGQENQTYHFGKYAIIIGMLSYTAWHLGKPVTELWGTPIWGLVAGTGAYYTRSIWPVLMAHWLLNIFLDAMILHNLHLPPF